MRTNAKGIAASGELLVACLQLSFSSTLFTLNSLCTYYVYIYYARALVEL